MRIRLFAPLFAALAMFLIPAGAAEAKVPIPCTGEKIVLVQQLTKGEQGESMGLGYLYQGCFSGKWIMHTGSSSQYKDVGELVLTLAKAQKGTDIAEPGFWWGMFNAPGQFWGEWLWLVGIGFIGFAAIFAKKGDGSTSSDNGEAMSYPQSSMGPAPAMATPLASAPTSSMSVRRTSAASAAPMRRVAGQSKGFGKR